MDGQREGVDNGVCDGSVDAGTGGPAFVARPRALAGFWLGREFGHRLFEDDVRLLKTSRLHEAEEFFAKYGGLSGARALRAGRPNLRPLAAGAAEMHWRRFTVLNIPGGVTRVVVMPLVGVLLGGIPFLAHTSALAIEIVVISVLPVVLGTFRSRRNRRKSTTEADTHATGRTQ
ncbi:DedA family protein [Curtobacterium sp. ISL-83]|uniref:DedA family protein n=1 Tax=Curtobacterium sp. ISL-83 TaxID=2819145 RepID=UPI001BE8865F|nr:SNARE-like domain protein [Curtobacterium sp. ISL-83]MBT2504161.1 SNARE-like domain protein [Curtobacterium sp. ISL-83]